MISPGLETLLVHESAKQWVGLWWFLFSGVKSGTGVQRTPASQQKLANQQSQQVTS